MHLKASRYTVFPKQKLEYDFEIVELVEIKAIDVSIKLVSINLKITAIYRSPESCSHKFNDLSFNCIENYKTTDYHVIAGDININLLETDEYIEDYKNISSSFAYESYINRVTRPVTKKCLDHFYVKKKGISPSTNLSAFIVQQDITDHYTTILSLPVIEPLKSQAERTKRYMNYNI
ncbi:hypothetical protein HHI36_013419 [Cryptolaemus montrouzieri]|uniref:Endonuclease/exonuclease/phosphatase domain-containing protein n=1 Tax=Cryptolaemus montrouzieri TaxID=559131 RepID=A0ABD2NI79_9CUCU